MFQYGGQYERNFDFHQRNDNGAGIFAANVYQVSNGSGINYTPFVPSNIPSSQVSNWDTYYSEILGLVSQSQTLYSRTGSNLTLQPLGTPLFDQDIIPSYDLYFSDTWHMRKDLTLTYGLSWNLEMPPYEVNGKQVELTDPSGHPITAEGYLSRSSKCGSRRSAEFGAGGGLHAHQERPGRQYKVSLQPVLQELQPPRFGGL